MMVKYLLFTSSTCTACPAMKRNLKKAGIEFEELGIDLKVSCIMASKLYQVKSLPTLVITQDGNPIESCIGVYPVSELVKIKERYKFNE